MRVCREVSLEGYFSIKEQSICGLNVERRSCSNACNDPSVESTAVYKLVFEQAGICLRFRCVDERSELNFCITTAFYLSGPRTLARAVFASQP